MIAYVEDRLPAEPGAVTKARHALAVALLPQVPEDVLSTTLLLATEIVSAALRRTNSPWHLRVEVDPGLVKVAVDFLADVPLGSDTDEPGLKGLLLDTMSDGWSVTMDRAGGTSNIWFQLYRVPPPV